MLSGRGLLPAPRGPVKDYVRKERFYAAAPDDAVELIAAAE